MKIETKYDIGDTIWYIKENTIVSSVIKYIHIYPSHIGYLTDLGHFESEKNLFPTRESLIEKLLGNTTEAETKTTK